MDVDEIVENQTTVLAEPGRTKPDPEPEAAARGARVRNDFNELFKQVPTRQREAVDELDIVVDQTTVLAEPGRTKHYPEPEAMTREARALNVSMSVVNKCLPASGKPWMRMRSLWTKLPLQLSVAGLQPTLGRWKQPTKLAYGKCSASFLYKCLLGSGTKGESDGNQKSRQRSRAAIEQNSKAPACDESFKRTIEFTEQRWVTYAS